MGSSVAKCAWYDEVVAYAENRRNNPQKEYPLVIKNRIDNHISKCPQCKDAFDLHTGDPIDNIPNSY